MIILDLDNCISNDAWRIPMIDYSKKHFERYHDYHSLAPFDEVCNTDLFTATSLNIVVATARPIIYKVATLEWLKRKGIDPMLLLMREKEGVSSVELKRQFTHEIFRMFDARPPDIVCAYDDRQDIVDMYRSLGINAEVRAIHSIKSEG